MKAAKSETTGMYRHIQGNTTFRGAFSIYQARNGSIMLAMNNGAIRLEEKQVGELGIDVYSLSEFDYDLFKDHYAL